jgi:hypothetical protein
MAHTSIPNNFFTLPAVIIAGETAAILHLRALLWSNENGGADIPTEALPMLSGRPDAGELALRLVGAGLWAQTAAGWSIGDAHARYVSAVRSAAGKRSGEVRRERKEQRANKTATPVEQPRTVYAGARPDSDPDSGKIQKTTATDPEAREAAKPEATKAVAVPLSLHPEGKRLFNVFVREAGDAFNSFADRPMRVELANRLAASRLDDETVVVMARLCAKPKTVWGWSTKLAPLPITVAWLLGKVSDDGTRTGAPLACLVSAARDILRRERANAEARQRAVDDANDARRKRAEAMAQKGAPPPVVSAESVRAALANAPFVTNPATIERIANAARRNVAA